jgi:UDP-glucose 4-epimerase
MTDKLKMKTERGSADGAIVVTGIAGNLGQRVAQRLHKDYKLVGLDRRPTPPRLPKDIVHHRVDLRRKKAQDLFRTSKIHGLLHMGIMHDPRAGAKEHYMWNVVGTETLLDYCAKYGVKKLVLVSSANNYGPLAGASAYMNEDAPLLGSFAFPEIRDLVAVDRLVTSFFWKHPEIETVVLRPVHIAGRRLRNAPSNFLRLKVIPTLMGFDPLVQLVHELDLVEAIRLALQPGVRGVFNIVGPPAIPMHRLLKLLGKQTVPVPHPIAKPLWSMFYRMRLSNFPAPEWDFLRYEMLVDGTRAEKDLGYKPKHSIADIVEMYENLEVTTSSGPST